MTDVFINKNEHNQLSLTIDDVFIGFLNQISFSLKSESFSENAEEGFLQINLKALNFNIVSVEKCQELGKQRTDFHYEFSYEQGFGKVLYCNIQLGSSDRIIYVDLNEKTTTNLQKLPN